MPKRILVNSLILSFGIILGRLSGYIRELIIATKYDVSSTADNIILMLIIPDFINNLLSIGVLSGLLIPLITDKYNIEDLLNEFITKLFILSLVLYLVVFTLIFFMYDFYLFTLIGISLLSIFFNVISFVSSSYLQYEEKFKVQSLNTLVFNTVLIVFLILGFYSYVFAFGVILASFIRMLWIMNDIRQTNLNMKTVLIIKNKTNIMSYKILIFMLLANGIIFVLPIIDKIFASFLNAGSVSILSYAEKVYLLPVSTFLTTYAIAMFPSISKLVTTKSYLELNYVLKNSIITNFVISLFIGCTLYYYSMDVINLIYGITGLKDESLLNISSTFNGYLLSLVLAGSNAILLKVIFAHKWYNEIIYYSISLITLKLFLNTLIVEFLGKIEYISIGTSFLMFISIIYLMILYFIKMKQRKF